MRRLMTLAAVLAMTTATLAAGPARPAAAATAIRLEGAEGFHRSAIASSVRRQAGLDHARGEARAASTGPVPVQVIGADTAALEAAVRAAGGSVDAAMPGRVGALVPAERLTELEADPAVSRIAGRRQYRASDALHGAVTSEAVAPTGAAAWQTAAPPQLGAGVKVAVVDLSFGGLAAAQSSGDLPATGAQLHTVDQCHSGSPTQFDSDPHGTEVAAIVHDMAPAAELHLICVEDDLSLDLARQYILDQGITIVNGSFGDSFSFRGNGSGTGLPEVVQDLRKHGVLWVASAGNEGSRHDTFVPTTVDSVQPVQGGPSDDNPDGQLRFVPFAPGNYSLEFQVSGAADRNSVDVGIKWDDWDTDDSSDEDFDIYVVDNFTNPPQIANASLAIQAGKPGQIPVEVASVENLHGVTATYSLYIDRWTASAPNRRFDVFVEGPAALEPALVNAAGSLAEPAASPYAFTVGAYCNQTGSLESFSSQGPTIDGRVKPDISGPDGTSQQVTGNDYGPANASCTSGFTGTSASAPHVAGAAALVSSANPALDIAEVQAVLQARANDAGPVGADNQYGAGRLRLGTAPPPPPSRATPQPFTGVSPVRIYDTRPGGPPVSHGDARLGAGETVGISIAGQAFGGTTVPADATAVVLNVTTTNVSAPSFFTIFPTGVARPNSSSLNFVPGQTVPNSVTAAVGNGGNVSVYNFAGNADLIIDLMGWYAPGSGAGLVATTPARAVDTRPGVAPVSNGDQKLAPNGVFTQPFRGQTFGSLTVPDDATAVVANVTVVNPTRVGFLTVFPSGTTAPLASTSNFQANQVFPNLVIAALGSGPSGGVSFFNGSQGTTDLIVDVVGYYAPTATSGYVALAAPYRNLDTRLGNGPVLVRQAGTHEDLDQFVDGMTGVRRDAVALLFNTTVTEPQGPGFLTAYPSNDAQPPTSNLNYTRGTTVANAVLTGVSPTAPRAARITTNLTTCDIINDVQGYFAPMAAGT
jgi:hypothetical protein